MQKITLTSTGSANRFLELLRSHEVAKIATEVAYVALAEVLLTNLVNVVQAVFLGKIYLSFSD